MSININALTQCEFMVLVDSDMHNWIVCAISVPVS